MELRISEYYKSERAETFSEATLYKAEKHVKNKICSNFQLFMEPQLNKIWVDLKEVLRDYNSIQNNVNLYRNSSEDEEYAENVVQNVFHFTLKLYSLLKIPLILISVPRWC